MNPGAVRLHGESALITNKSFALDSTDRERKQQVLIQELHIDNALILVIMEFNPHSGCLKQYRHLQKNPTHLTVDVWGKTLTHRRTQPI